MLKQVHVDVQARELLCPDAAGCEQFEIVGQGFAAEDQLDLPLVKDLGEILRVEQQLEVDVTRH